MTSSGSILRSFTSGFSVLSFATALLAIQMTGAFYHLTSPTHPCRVTSPENDTVDLICQYREGFVTSSHHVGGHACAWQRVVWQRADYHLTTNITDTSKYGVWEAVPGWRMEKGMRISLLRMRRIQPEDVGLYQCRIQCGASDGRITVTHHMADICIDHGQPGYSICGTHSLDSKCYTSYKNGICDPECDNEENLYDGFDCAADVRSCDPAGHHSCQRRFANGVCDQECDSTACAFDGGDCIDRPLTFADDLIVLTLPRWYETSGKVVDVKALGRTLSLLLRTVVRVMPSDWNGPRHLGRVQPGGGDASWHSPDKRGFGSARRIYLRIDNTMCRRRCFADSLYAAKFIDLALKHGWQPGIPVSTVGVLGPTVNRCSLENNTLLHIDLPISAPKESNPNIYSYTYAETSTELPPTWLLVLATVGSSLIIVLVVVIVLIIIRIRKLTREDRSRADADAQTIRDKNAPQGTDV